MCKYILDLPLSLTHSKQTVSLSFDIVFALHVYFIESGTLEIILLC